jgi:hypothetical protein
MAGARKRFDKDLFDRYDALARAAGIEYLKKKRGTIAIWPNPARYGADLLYTYRRTVKSEVEERSLECEVKAVWPGGKFKYDTVQVPERKRKFFAANGEYFLLAKNSQDYLLISPEAVLESALVEVPNKYCFKDEYFFQVPLANVTFRQLDEVADPKRTFCCDSLKLERTGINDVWVCAGCGKAGA